MKIIENIENISAKPKAVTIGNFDGIHKGHQSLIKKTLTYMMVTFRMI